MIQPAHEIEEHYNKPDPWGYQTNPDDIIRKEQIISIAKAFVPYGMNQFGSVLDIGAGEGWITKDLPAVVKYGYELSEQARSRFPEGVTPCREPIGPYDLVTACGILYPHYDTANFFEFFKMATRFVVTCNIEAWEVNEIKDPGFLHEMKLTQIVCNRFKYREYYQKLRVFKVNPR